MGTALNVQAWSTTAASNDGADSTIGTVANTSSPTSVDDWVRGIMAAVKKYVLDTDGGITAGGTADALTITTNRAISAAHQAAGFSVRFKASATNTGAATVAVDSLTAVSIKRLNGDALSAGDIASGGIYDLAFDGTNYILMGASAGYGTLAGSNTWTGTNTFSSTAAGTALTITSTDAGASGGPDLSLYRNSASPAASDFLSAILWDGKDSGGTQTTYGRIRVRIDDTTDGSEDATMFLGVVVAGTYTDQVRVANALFAPVTTGAVDLGNSSWQWGSLSLSGTIDLGHASDTTLARSAAGVVTVEGNTLCRIKTGTYTGDGATSKSVTGVGFTPKYVRVWPRITTGGSNGVVHETTTDIIDDNGSGQSFVLDAGSTPAFLTATDAIIALGSDGFTVDDAGVDGHPNKTGTVYNYLCLG